MMEKWIDRMSKLRWIIIVAWFILAFLTFFGLPDLQSAVRQTEQKFLPADAQSVQATRLLQDINPSTHSLSNAVIVLHREGKLTEDDKSWMSRLASQIQSRKDEFRITSLLSAQTEPELAERLISKDGSTLIAIVNLPYTDFQDATKETLIKLKQLLTEAPQGATARLTGGAALSQDFQQTSESGLRKTELVTVGIVLLILFIVFRSPVTPIIPLITIGISYLISQSIISQMSHFGIPISHFTESFLIAVLFGAGTDYCMLMVQRYREELRKELNGNRIAAATRMMNGVGKTVLYSASTVMVAFLLIGFAEFGLYRSAAGVAIGMLVTTAAALTLTPALLLALGKYTFWPYPLQDAKQHRESKLWHYLSSLAARRSALVLLSAVILLGPLTLLYHDKRSFDDISEISPRLESIVGFRQVERAFSSGEVFPITVALTSSQSMRTKSGLAALEQISSELTRDAAIQEVRSAMRPLGRKPEQLTVSGQLRQQPNIDQIIASIMKDQQTLVGGLESIAKGAVPLSQGVLGMIPTVRGLGDGVGKLIAAQFSGLQRVSHSGGTSATSQSSEAARQALDYYISPDGLTTKLELILEMNPYSNQAMKSIPLIGEHIRSAVASTSLTEPKVYMTGVSAKYNELSDISNRDFIRTSIFVLAGIAIVLILLLRSILAPLYMLLSLAFNYVITMGILEFVFVDMLGYPGLSWTVSFFVFLIIVALGVDYSIFLMARFKEEHRLGGPELAMAKAMRTTGGIIASAAVIMAGTFGALGFSGVNTLVQIGVGTLIGLIVYATIFMALVVPACAFLLGEANWWPFHPRSSKK